MPIHLTRIVKGLVIANFVAFVVQHTGDQFLGTHFLSWFGLTSAGLLSNFYLWQLVTYAFLHYDVMHLFLNLMMLVFIGGDLEATWGSVRFIRYYLFCAIAVGVVYVLLQPAGVSIPLIGASGAIYGLLTAYGLIFGERVLLFMMLFPMKAKHFIWVLALIELMTSLFSSQGVWASIAHLTGMAAGFAYLWVRASLILAKKRSASNRPGFLDRIIKKRKKSGHLKLIVNNDRDFEAPSNDEESGKNPKTWH